MNEKEFEFCRIDQWHKAGFTGKGIKVGVHEISSSKIANLPRYKGKVKDPFGVKFTTAKDTHAQNVVDTVLTVAPDVDIYMMGENHFENVAYAANAELDLYNYSATGGNSGKEFDALERAALEKGCFFVCCAGNDGAYPDSLTIYSRKTTWLSVGAVRWTTWQGIEGPQRSSYSSWDLKGDNLDVMGFSDSIRIPSELQPDKIMGVSGTSFAAPWVVGMIALWKQKFIQENFRKPTFTETFKFVISNCQDIETPGYDQKTGFGVFRLPEIKQENVIELWIDKMKALKNGQEITLNIAPKLLNNRTMVGLRDVANLLDCEVIWNQKEQKITIKK